MEFSITILFFANFLDVLALNLYLPILNREIKKLGGSLFTIGLIRSTYGAIQIFSCPIMGCGSDIYGTKFVYLIAIVATIFGNLVQGFVGSWSGLLIARVIRGCFKHTGTLGKTLLIRLANKPKQSADILAKFNAFGNMGSIIAPYVYVLVSESMTGYDHGLRSISFFAAGILFFNAILVTFFIPPVPPIEKSPKAPASSFNYKLLTAKELLLLLARFFFSFAALVARANLQLILESKYETSMVTFSFLHSMQAFISTISGFTVGHVVLKYYEGNVHRMLFNASLLQLISLIAFFLSPTFEMAAISLLLLSASSPYIRVGIVSISLGNRSEPGKILGVGQTAISIARMCSPLLAGISQEVISDDGPTIVGIIASILGIGILALCSHTDSIHIKHD